MTRSWLPHGAEHVKRQSLAQHGTREAAASLEIEMVPLAQLHSTQSAPEDRQIKGQPDRRDERREEIDQHLSLLSCEVTGRRDPSGK